MKCDPNIKKPTDGTNALIVAVKRNNFDSVLILLERGADVNIRNENGLTAFDYSILYSNYEICLYLNKKYNLEVRDMEFYLEHRSVIKAPLFNVKLFLENLNQNVPFNETPSFKLSVEQYKGRYCFTLIYLF
jgi:ankyrin repeat protein